MPVGHQRRRDVDVNNDDYGRGVPPHADEDIRQVLYAAAEEQTGHRHGTHYRRIVVGESSEESTKGRGRRDYRSLTPAKCVPMAAAGERAGRL